jgi:hypothetical protein
MMKRFIFVVSLAITFLAAAPPAHAQGLMEIYVDSAWTGSEDGTQAKPYNTYAEGFALARAQPGGAWLNTKQADGTWRREYIRPAVSGPLGTPLADASLYALLAVLALVLILVGWRFQRRSAQLPAR